ncbi:MAG: class I SAM-dependent methyltransferase [Planctomycetes bacterium]|nr:class I SAM-dependent methyltransferase [Planctomycetota bacterium]
MRPKPLASELEAVCPLCDRAHPIRLESVACNLCGADRKEELFWRGDLALGLGGRFRVVRCGGCGLRYLDPRPAAEDIDYYYPPSYEMHRPTPAPGTRDGYAAWRQDFCQRKRCRLVSRHRRHGRALDVGCADGHFLRVLSRWGEWDVRGVERAAAVAGRARERHGLDVTTGSIAEVELPAAHFDLVTLWDVIEHLHDPRGALERIAASLKPGGLLVLSTPVSNSLDARLFGRYWIGYEIPRHLYFFSMETLTALLAATGFKIVETRVLFGSDFALADQLRFTLRGRGAPLAVYGAASVIARSRPWRWALAPIFKLLDLAKLTTPRTVVCVKGG